MKFSFDQITKIGLYAYSQYDRFLRLVDHAKAIVNELGDAINEWPGFGFGARPLDFEETLAALEVDPRCVAIVREQGVAAVGRPKLRDILANVWKLATENPKVLEVLLTLIKL